MIVIEWIVLKTSTWPAGGDVHDNIQKQSSKSGFVKPKGTRLRGVAVRLKRSAWKKNVESCLSV